MKSVLIAGQGRSGTNWLVDILDHAANTLCANERNEISRSILSELPSAAIDCGQYAGLEAVWDWVVDETKHRFGERDPASRSKNFLYRGWRSKFLYAIRSRQRLRHLISLFDQSLAGAEWQAPRYLVKMNRLDQALLVLKFNRCPALACWLLRDSPGRCSVVQILRHPGGALNSWQQRFLKFANKTLVSLNNQCTLRSILALDDGLSASTKDKIVAYLGSNEKDVFYSEALYWLYASEKIYQCGNEANRRAEGSGTSVSQISRNYVFVKYEMLCADTANVVRDLYSFLGLELEDWMMDKISADSRRSVEIAEHWKDALTREQRMAVEKVLEGSVFERMWG